MLLLWKFAAGLLCLSVPTAAAPPPPPGDPRPSSSVTCRSSTHTTEGTWASGTSTPISSSPSSSSSPVKVFETDCLIGGKCDCARIEDKNGEEYFQCVTDPNCDRCWVSIVAGTTTSPTSRPPPFSMGPWPSSSSSSSSVPRNSTSTQRTATPWQDTKTSSRTTATSDDATGPTGLTLTRVPSDRTPRPRPWTSTQTTSSSSSSTSSPRIVTVVETKILTVSVVSTATTTSPPEETSPRSPWRDPEDCPAACDCSGIEDKDSDEYFQCLTRPGCEGCPWTSTPPDPTPTETRVLEPTNGIGPVVETVGGPPPPPPPPPPPKTSTSTSTSTTSKTLPPRPRPTCPAYCDCSKIKDKQSDEFFQCITNPNCEKCRAGGGG